MATASNEFGMSTPTSSLPFTSFDFHSSSNLFAGSAVDHLKQQAQLQQLLFQQQQQQLSSANDPGQFEPSSGSSPVPTRFSPVENPSPTFDQASPEKRSLSQSPPSPADSGVVADTKLESGNISHDLLQDLDSSKSDSAVDFLSTRGIASSLSFDTLPHTCGLKARDNSISSGNSLGFGSNGFDVGLGMSSADETEPCISLSQSLAAIWSTPTPTVAKPEYPLSTSMDDMMLQALEQQQQQQQLSQQQQLTPWPSQVNDLSGVPTGLLGNAALQRQYQQSTANQIQAIQQQLLRRSQSLVPPPTGLSRSTSHQPGYRGMGNVNGLNGMKMNGLLPSSKQPASYSSWSNGSTALGNTWPTPTNRNASALLNSLSNNNRVLSGASDLGKQAMPPQMPHPPRLSRSISTPAKYNSYYNGSSIPELEDNPFFKTSDALQQNGLMTLNDNGVNNLMSLTGLQTQLADIIQANGNNQAFANHNPLQRGSAGPQPRRRGKWMDLSNDILFEESTFNPIAANLNGQLSSLLGEYQRDRYSRKVFVGGLPPDIDEDEIKASFQRFGSLVVDWPHKAECKSYFPPKGYAFLLFQEEMSVQNLINSCMRDGDKLYLRVSSPTIRDKPVQIRPWNLSDSDFVLDGSQPLDPRKTIFVGGVPRPLRAIELAMIMDRLYGGVCYAGIDVDPELKYPKGAGRVAFSNQQSYIAAISARFVQLQHGDIDKRVEVKPYVLDDQDCDECRGMRCGGKFAPFFCANVSCLQYFCEQCWALIHSRPGKELHKPLVKEGADRASRSMNSYRWQMGGQI